ncbi:unnamed protein product, partial [Mesorhabditis spiculigera]
MVRSFGSALVLALFTHLLLADGVGDSAFQARVRRQEEPTASPDPPSAPPSEPPTAPPTEPPAPTTCEYPFVCYTQEWMITQGMKVPVPDPELCKKSTEGCQAPACELGHVFADKSGAKNWIAECDPTALFCKPDSTEAGCIKPTPVQSLIDLELVVQKEGDEKDKNWEYILFPFNFCTRQMIIAGSCPADRFEKFNPAQLTLSPKYVPMCDAGYVMPKSLRTGAKSTWSCLFNIHQAAGMLPEALEVAGEGEDWDVLRPGGLCPDHHQHQHHGRKPCPLAPICSDVESGRYLPAILAELGMKFEKPTYCNELCYYKGRGRSEAGIKDDREDCIWPGVIIDKAPVYIGSFPYSFSGPFADWLDDKDFSAMTLAEAADRPAPTDTSNLKYPRCYNITKRPDIMVANLLNHYELEEQKVCAGVFPDAALEEEQPSLGVIFGIFGGVTVLLFVIGLFVVISCNKSSGGDISGEKGKGKKKKSGGGGGESKEARSTAQNDEEKKEGEEEKPAESVQAKTDLDSVQA